MDGAVKGHCFRVIIRIRVEYEQYFMYGRADRKVNNAITFEPSKYRADSVGIMLGQQISTLEQLEW